MKKISILFIAFMLLIQVQDLQAQAFSIKAGLNFANILEKDEDEIYSDDFKSSGGTHIGISLDFSPASKVSWEMGVLYSTRGAKYISDDWDYTETVKSRYIDVPMMLKISTPIDSAFKWYAGFGPYIAYGIGGTVVTEYDDDDDKDTEVIKWGDRKFKDDLKPLDYGAVFGGGIEYKKFLFEMSYNLGFANISPYQEDEYQIKNRLFKISIGYML